MDIGKISLAIVYFFLGIVEVLLGFRFALKLLAANSTAVFTDWIYAASAPLVAPFEGVFPSFQIVDFTLELPAVLAMIVYGAVGVIAALLLRNFEGMRVKPALPGTSTAAMPVMQAPVPQQPIVQVPQQQAYVATPQPMQTQPVQAQPVQTQPMQPQVQPPQQPAQQPSQSFNDSLGQFPQIPQQENSPFSS